MCGTSMWAVAKPPAIGLRAAAAPGGARGHAVRGRWQRPLNPPCPPAPPRRAVPPAAAGGGGSQVPAEEVSSNLRLQRMGELAEHKAEWGHCNAVLGSPLGKWVYLQRRMYKDGKLSDQEVADLTAMGFEWVHPYDKVMDGPEGWAMMVAELKQFKEERGHVDVKKKEPANPALGYWVNDQRVAYREGRLAPENVALLESLGIDWVPKKQCGSKFMIGFRQLVAYRDAHDTINVPAEEEELSAWCRAQRAAYEKGLLSEKRVGYLEGVGFFESTSGL